MGQIYVRASRRAKAHLRISILRKIKEKGYTSEKNYRALWDKVAKGHRKGPNKNNLFTIIQRATRKK